VVVVVVVAAAGDGISAAAVVVVVVAVAAGASGTNRFLTLREARVPPGLCFTGSYKAEHYCLFV
jgi:hypothetical protein